MIDLCSGKYQARHDGRQWVLTEYYEGYEKKTKVPKLCSRETYHGTFAQVCGFVIDRELTSCESLEEVVSLLKNARDVLKPEDLNHATE